jgi:hypothetical protein
LHQSIILRKKKLELSLNNRQSAFLILWSKVEDGRLPHGALRSAANFFLVDTTTISRLWRGVKNKLNDAVNNQTSNLSLQTSNSLKVVASNQGGT